MCSCTNVRWSGWAGAVRTVWKAGSTVNTLDTSISLAGAAATSDSWIFIVALSWCGRWRAWCRRRRAGSPAIANAVASEYITSARAACRTEANDACCTSNTEGCNTGNCAASDRSCAFNSCCCSASAVVVVVRAVGGLLARGTFEVAEGPPAIRALSHGGDRGALYEELLLAAAHEVVGRDGAVDGACQLLADLRCIGRGGGSSDAKDGEGDDFQIGRAHV